MTPDQPGAPAVDDLRTFLAARSAVLPPLPDDLLASIRQTAPDWWETSAFDDGSGDPTDRALAGGADRTLDHFLLVGLSGRGFASYFFHVVRAEGPLVVVARLHAPTAFDDELGRPSLTRVFLAIGQLTEAANAARAGGVLGAGERLLVLDDERSTRYQYGIARHGVVDWRRSSSTQLFDDAASALTAGGHNRG